MPLRCPPLTSLTSASILLLIPGVALRAADPEPAAAAPAAASAATTAAESNVGLPTFRFGLWEYRRTVMRADADKPQVAIVKKCSDPGADMREKMENLKKKDCQFAPLRHTGERYISSWVCQTPSGAMRFRDVLTAKDANSYQDVSETRTAQRVAQQKIDATRLGDCPGMGSGAPLLPTPKPRRPPPLTPPKA